MVSISRQRSPYVQVQSEYFFQTKVKCRTELCGGRKAKSWDSILFCHPRKRSGRWLGREWRGERVIGLECGDTRNDAKRADRAEEDVDQLLTHLVPDCQTLLLSTLACSLERKVPGVEPRWMVRSRPSPPHLHLESHLIHQPTRLSLVFVALG